MEYHLKQDGKAVFEKAEEVKKELLEKAFSTYEGSPDLFPKGV